jgi:hypothetical protein
MLFQRRAELTKLDGIMVFVVMIVWYLNLQLPIQSVPIATNTVSWNSAHGEM